jgi:nitronate monooxygenase
MTTLFDKLEISLPVWNAGMGGGLAGPELVAAVNAGGGFGVLGTGGGISPTMIRQLVQDTKALTSRPFGANIILPMSDGNDVAAVFDSDIDVLVLFWGDPQPFIKDARKRGMFVVCQCGNGDDAVRAEESGVDAIILQGTEAGGHIKSEQPLMDTIKEVKPHLSSIPFMASGGISDGLQIAQILNTGAHAASLGTRFLMTTESKAHAKYKEMLAAKEQTVLTTLYDKGWEDAPHRILRNQDYDIWEEAGYPESGTRPGEHDTVGSTIFEGNAIEIPRYSAFPAVDTFRGDVEATPLYAGESVSAIDDIEGCANVIERLTNELKEAAK